MQVRCVLLDMSSLSEDTHTQITGTNRQNKFVTNIEWNISSSSSLDQVHSKVSFSFIGDFYKKVAPCRAYDHLASQLGHTNNSPWTISPRRPSLPLPSSLSLSRPVGNLVKAPTTTPVSIPANCIFAHPWIRLCARSKCTRDRSELFPHTPPTIFRSQFSASAAAVWPTVATSSSCKCSPSSTTSIDRVRLPKIGLVRVCVCGRCRHLAVSVFELTPWLPFLDSCFLNSKLP